MQTRFFLTDGRSVYAPYLKESERIGLKKQLEENSLKMYCGCSKESPLYYGISSDLRIIPLHKHYVHKTWCSRYDSGRRTSAAVYAEDGSVTVYMSFKANTFTMGSAKADEEELSDLELQRMELRREAKEKERERLEALGIVKEEKEKLPSFNLYELVRFINHDTYMSRIAAGKYPYLSEDYFLSALNSHIKSVRIAGMRKSLKEFSIKEDKMQFFYARLDEVTEKGIVYPGFGGNMIRRFVPATVLEKALNSFQIKYGLSVMEHKDIGTVMVSGFIYERLNHKGAAYKCIGRLVFFPVTEYGLYADSLPELDIVTSFMRVCKRHKCLFLYSDENKNNTVGIIRNNASGKEAPVFFNRKGKGYEGDFFACGGLIPSEEEIEAFLPVLT